MKRTTLAAIALVLVPSFAAAQQTTDTTRTPVDTAQHPPSPQDTVAVPQQVGPANQNPTQVQTPTTEPTPADSAAQVNAPAQDTAASQDTAVSAQPTGAASARSGRNMGLTRSQVRQLQEALNSTGCDAGKVDGIIGPRTRAAIDCARSQKGISGDDNTELYRALNLNFEADSASGRNIPGAAADTSGAAAGAATDTTGAAAGAVTTDTTTKTDTTIKSDTTTTQRPPR